MKQSVQKNKFNASGFNSNQPVYQPSLEYVLVKDRVAQASSFQPHSQLQTKITRVHLQITDEMMFVVNVVIYGLCAYIFSKTILYCCPVVLMQGAFSMATLLVIRRAIESLHNQ